MTVLARVTMPLTLMSLLMSLGSRSRMTFDSARLNVFNCKVECPATCSVVDEVPAASPSVHWMYPLRTATRSSGSRAQQGHQLCKTRPYSNLVLDNSRILEFVP